MVANARAGGVGNGLEGLHGARVGDWSQQSTFQEFQFAQGVVPGGASQLQGLAGQVQDRQLGIRRLLDYELSGEEIPALTFGTNTPAYPEIARPRLRSGELRMGVRNLQICPAAAIK